MIPDGPIDHFLNLEHDRDGAMLWMEQSVSLLKLCRTLIINVLYGQRTITSSLLHTAQRLLVCRGSPVGCCHCDGTADAWEDAHRNFRCSRTRFKNTWGSMRSCSGVQG